MTFRITLGSLRVAATNVLMLCATLALGACSERDGEIVKIESDVEGVFLEISQNSLPKGISEEELGIRSMSREEIHNAMRAVGKNSAGKVYSAGYDFSPDGVEFSDLGYLTVPFNDKFPIFIHVHEGIAKPVEGVTYELSESGNKAVVPIAEFSFYVSWLLGDEGPFYVHAAASDSRVGEPVDVTINIAKDPSPTTTFTDRNLDRVIETAIHLPNLPAELRQAELTGGGGTRGGKQWEDIEFESFIKLESRDIVCTEKGSTKATLETWIDFWVVFAGRSVETNLDCDVADDGCINPEWVHDYDASSLPETITVKLRLDMKFECLPEKQETEPEQTTPAADTQLLRVEIMGQEHAVSVSAISEFHDPDGFDHNENIAGYIYNSENVDGNGSVESWSWEYTPTGNPPVRAVEAQRPLGIGDRFSRQVSVSVRGGGQAKAALETFASLVDNEFVLNGSVVASSKMPTRGISDRADAEVNFSVGLEIKTPATIQVKGCQLFQIGGSLIDASRDETLADLDLDENRTEETPHGFQSKDSFCEFKTFFTREDHEIFQGIGDGMGLEWPGEIVVFTLDAWVRQTSEGGDTDIDEDFSIRVLPLKR